MHCLFEPVCLLQSPCTILWKAANSGLSFPYVYGNSFSVCHLSRQQTLKC